MKGNWDRLISSKIITIYCDTDHTFSWNLSYPRKFKKCPWKCIWRFFKKHNPIKFVTNCSCKFMKICIYLGPPSWNISTSMDQYRPILISVDLSQSWLILVDPSQSRSIPIFIHISYLDISFSIFKEVISKISKML